MAVCALLVLLAAAFAFSSAAEYELAFSCFGFVDALASLSLATCSLLTAPEEEFPFACADFAPALLLPPAEAAEPA